MSREVVASFGETKPTISFEVEYQDSQGNWELAVGSWANGDLHLSSSYPSQAAASIDARSLTKVCGWNTRVVKVVSGD